MSLSPSAIAQQGFQQEERTMSAIEKLAKKYRRALRTGGGAQFTIAELRLMADLGALALVQAAEESEIRAGWATIDPPADTAPQEVAASPVKPPSGKSPANKPHIDRAVITALFSKM